MEIIGSLYTGTSEKFFRGLYPIARCIKAQNNDLGVAMAEVKVIGSLESRFESTNRIYDSGGGESDIEHNAGRKPGAEDNGQNVRKKPGKANR